MSWEDHDGLERGGVCNTCGAEVEQEHHAYCADCYAAAQGWTRPARPARPDPVGLAFQNGHRAGYREGYRQALADHGTGVA